VEKVVTKVILARIKTKQKEEEALEEEVWSGPMLPPQWLYCSQETSESAKSVQ